jgi:hypothetical protein
MLSVALRVPDYARPSKSLGVLPRESLFGPGIGSLAILVFSVLLVATQV